MVFEDSVSIWVDNLESLDSLATSKVDTFSYLELREEFSNRSQILHGGKEYSILVGDMEYVCIDRISNNNLSFNQINKLLDGIDGDARGLLEACRRYQIEDKGQKYF